MEQYLPTLPNDMSSRPVLGRVLVARSLFFCVMSCRFLFVLLSFSFDHCVVCPSLTFGFWLPPFGIFKLFFGRSGIFCFSFYYPYFFNVFFLSICCGIYNFLNFCVSSIVEHWYFIHKWYFQCIQLGVTQLIGCLYWPIHEDAITVINESPTMQ